MSDHPYRNHQLPDLESLAEARSKDPEELARIAEELSRRKSPRAAAALQRILIRIAEMGGVLPTADTGTTPDYEWTAAAEEREPSLAPEMDAHQHQVRGVVLPDWRKWLADNASKAASDAIDYDLHLAAVEWSLASALDINSIEDFESLPSPTIEPFAHQVENAILYFRRLAPRGLIADDVGLGKTITAGLIARELLDRGRIESILVVCPKSLVDQWREELESKFAIHAQTGQFQDLDSYPFWITSYATAAKRIPEIRSRKFDLLILDEAHALRNLYGSPKPPKVATEFEALMRSDVARFVIMLTATPIQNRLWDVFSLLEILRAPQPNPLGAPDQFRTTFLADTTARRFQAGSQAEFRQRLSETTIRTRRADSRLLFPEREVKDQRLKPLPAEQEYIDRALDALLELPRLEQITHAKTLMSSPWAAAVAFEKLSHDPRFDAPKRATFQRLASDGRSIQDSAKSRAVVELAKASMRGGRAGRLIVFTQRLETLRHLTQSLGTAGLGGQIGIIQGGEHLANRRSIRDFVAEPPSRPVLLSSDTGAVGLNLQAGNIVVNYDLPWNPMLIEQRIGRVQRLGQKANKVIVYNLVLAGTIEDHVVLRLMEKLNLFNQAIGEMEELLELCGYDEEKRPLEQVVMDLIRKAAEQKDIQEDLRRMEESRRAAEAKLKEMREATDNALKSLKPKDSAVRLEGLERPEPRLALRDLIVGCLKRGGAAWREDGEGRIFARTRDGDTQLCFDRHDYVPGHEHMRLVMPGARAFEHITKQAREDVAHHVLNATSVDLEYVERTLADALRGLGMVVDTVKTVNREPRTASRLAVKVVARVASDQYETIVESTQCEPADGVRDLLWVSRTVTGPDGKPLPKSAPAEVKQLTPVLQALDPALRGAALTHESVRKFCEFYEHRYQEDLARLADHVRQGYGPTYRGDAEGVVSQAAETHREVRVALDSIRSRFRPSIRVEPVGLTSLQYERTTIEARVRNRAQRESFSVRLEAIPLTGALLSPIPIAGELGNGEEGWACPGGHIAPEADFVRCNSEGCFSGACTTCVGTSAVGNTLKACRQCAAAVCTTHRRPCNGCGEDFCEAHAHRLDDGSGWSCENCIVILEDGRGALAGDVVQSAVSGRRGIVREMERSALSGEPAFPDELVTCEATGRRVLPRELRTCSVTGQRVAMDLVETSVVSGATALRDRMLRSSWSNRGCLPGEERLCDETGALLLPDEIGACARTGRKARKDLLEEDAETREPVLRRLLERSEESGKYALPEHLVASELSGQRALPSEIVSCEVCGRRILPRETLTCPDTGRRGCREHFLPCEKTGELVLPEALARCEVSGRQIRRNLLQRCPETGKLADPTLFEECQDSGAKVLPEGLETCSVTGKRVRRSLLGRCEKTSQPALPAALAASSVSGKRVHPDLLITCPDTGARLLPEEAVACQESGSLVSPLALDQCSASGRRVRRTCLATDDLSGQLVLKRLLGICEVTGRQTLAANLATSTVSGRRVLADRLVQCQESGRVALPEELGRCGVMGKAVHPDLLMKCPETGISVLRRIAKRCEASGDLASPDALETCEETGKSVRRSLLASDEVTGKRVQAKLLRVCEVTGRRTTAGNLVRSAVSGKEVLSEIAARCEETGSVALPSELARCSVSGKRVLPGLLQECAVSRRPVLLSLLVTCEATGDRVLPEHLGTCSRTGKRVLKTRLARSQLSGEVGLQELLSPCQVSGQLAFPDELRLSEVSGKRVVRDRLAMCEYCGRNADLTELFACCVCRQRSCVEDTEGQTCRACSALLGGKGARALSRAEIETVRRDRSWVRRGHIYESNNLLHLKLRAGLFRRPHSSRLLVVRKSSEPDAQHFGQVLREVAIGNRERQLAEGSSPPSRS